ncbi:MAG: DUF2181 domain-containing protein [Ferruginibacter sp.]
MLIVVGVDIVLHKGMSRVMLPASFTKQRSASTFETCKQSLISKHKKWIKGVNTVAQLQQLDSNTAGVEMDVYFDTLFNTLFVYHDSSNISTLKIESLLDLWTSKKMKGSIWLDFKNLSAFNKSSSLLYLSKIRDKYQLANKIIIEASNPATLDIFCLKGFFTSYYVPYFNPYNLTESELLGMVDEISALLAVNKVSALSGYYFQYPFLKKYFPEYSFLTWTDKSAISLVANIFNNGLLSDPKVSIVLFPQ